MYRKPIVRNRALRDRTLRDRTGWRNSGEVCALSDGHRHLGHIVLNAGRWTAFDATHPDDSGNGFKHLGTFRTIAGAKAAVESSCAKDSQLGSAWIF
jgi:hypothetical protein